MNLPFPDFSYLIQVVNLGFDMEVVTFSPAGTMSYSSLVGIHRLFLPLLRFCGSLSLRRSLCKHGLALQISHLS